MEGRREPTSKEEFEKLNKSIKQSLMFYRNLLAKAEQIKLLTEAMKEGGKEKEITKYPMFRENETALYLQQLLNITNINNKDLDSKILLKWDRKFSKNHVIIELYNKILSLRQDRIQNNIACFTSVIRESKLSSQEIIYYFVLKEMLECIVDELNHEEKKFFLRQWTRVPYDDRETRWPIEKNLQNKEIVDAKLKTIFSYLAYGIPNFEKADFEIIIEMIREKTSSEVMTEIEDTFNDKKCLINSNDKEIFKVNLVNILSDIEDINRFINDIEKSNKAEETYNDILNARRILELDDYESFIRLIRLRHLFQLIQFARKEINKILGEENKNQVGNIAQPLTESEIEATQFSAVSQKREMGGGALQNGSGQRSAIPPSEDHRDNASISFVSDQEGGFSRSISSASLPVDGSLNDGQASQPPSDGEGSDKMEEKKPGFFKRNKWKIIGGICGAIVTVAVVSALVLFAPVVIPVLAATVAVGVVASLFITIGLGIGAIIDSRNKSATSVPTVLPGVVSSDEKGPTEDENENKIPEIRTQEKPELCLSDAVVGKRLAENEDKNKISESETLEKPEPHLLRRSQSCPDFRRIKIEPTLQHSASTSNLSMFYHQPINPTCQVLPQKNSQFSSKL